jgi:hypothetical protein
MKGSAHRTTDDFGVPEVNRSGKGDDRGGAQRRSGPQDGADVAGVLNGVEDDESGYGRKVQQLEAPLRDLGNSQHPLRRLRLGGAREFVWRDFGDVDTSFAQRGKERGTARGVEKLGSGERATYVQWRSKQLLDGTHTFCREQLLALTCFPAPEIAR